MTAVVLAGVLATMALALARAWLGPTIFDRILGLNMFGTKTVLLISAGCFFLGRPDFLDLALLYALMNFIGVIAVLRFARHRYFGKPTARPPDTSWD
ncbi:MAG: monovalent cation/H+ antiporter complex subunit F [Planctomycetota bacterium]|jgi:multicomponent Na+:H+ antiporter subunit F